MDGNGVGNTYRGFKEDDDICDSTSNNGSISQDSMNSVSCSSELTEEEADSSTSSSSSHSNGPLYELSQLMNHLPRKRGLSMFYEGKSQSFTSLEGVQSKDDLPKKETPLRKKIKSCYARHKTLHTPKAKISKKSSRGISSSSSSSSVSVLSQRGSCLGMSRSSSIAVQNYF